MEIAYDEFYVYALCTPFEEILIVNFSFFFSFVIFEHICENITIILISRSYHFWLYEFLPY